MTNRSRESLIALRRILRTAEVNARSLARDTGLTTAQILVLQGLADAGPLSAKEISYRVGVSQPTMTAVVDRMAAKGLVTREKSDVDRRQTIIMITEAGRERLTGVPDPLQEIYSARFDALPDWEQAMIIAALERVVSLLDAHAVDAEPVLHVGTIDEDHHGDHSGGHNGDPHPDSHGGHNGDHNGDALRDHPGRQRGEP